MSDDIKDKNTDDAIYAGQILDGAKMIASYMIHLGFADMTEKKVFHWASDGRLPGSTDARPCSIAAGFIAGDRCS